MLIPKASHLVERVTERLLRSGALDESASQLLQQSAAAGPGAEPEPAPAPAGTPEPAASSLFAPPPVAAQSATQPAALPDNGEEPAWAASAPTGSPGPGSLPRTAAGILHQPRAADPVDAQAGVLDYPGSPAAPAAPMIGLGAPDDRAGGLLQSQMTVDAVSLERAGMVDWSRTRSRISEEFRLVQRQIIRSAFGPGAEPGFSNLLLVTSARPGEGKSFMSTNLAGSIARQGDHHVLLVDADSKRDSICYNLGLAQSRGLLDLAANPKLDPGPLIAKTPIERLSILPVGRERERSAELFSTKEMTRLIQSLGRRYSDRLLILDAPPCLSTSDPAILAQVVGQILFVVEADRTQRDEIEASLDLIQACPTITLVLNKQQISSRYTFGAYSSYYSS
ncbi:MAG: hypothetical protein B7Z80_08560 [Rhodospirillales bacterium 20-64-7]|nr:MAG: hypothetical protein B7Z80_08560 [Rhodospirillales bacterium 20-64-7]HQT78187.1 hypothetical protein [Rhodopila sp.]